MLGYGSEAVTCWANRNTIPRFSLLNDDRAPSKDEIDAYQKEFDIGDIDVMRDSLPLDEW